MKLSNNSSPNEGIVTTIQHYQEALSCLEVATRYLRNGQVPSSFKPQTFGLANASSSWAKDSYLGPEGTANATPPESSPSGCELSYDEAAVDIANVSGRTEGPYRPNAREPLRSYLARSKQASVAQAYASPSLSPSASKSPSDVDFAAVEGLMERCMGAITTLQKDLQTNNTIVKDSLQSLVESLKFQKRMLEKRRHKMQRLAASVQAAPAPAGAAVMDPQQPCSDSVQAAVLAMRLAPENLSGEEGLGNVVGLQEVKDVLNDAFVLPAQLPHLFQAGALQPWTRLLLYGPPGTGKTRLARAVASDLQCPLYIASPSLLLSSWLGDTEKILRELFRRAKSESGPVVIFLDEVDSICRTRTQHEDDVTRRIKTELLVHLDASLLSSSPPSYSSHQDHHMLLDEELPHDAAFMYSLDAAGGVTHHDSSSSSSSSSTVFIIAATNCPWDVDPAFMRRFQKRCYVPLPNSNERLSLLQAGLSGCSTDLSPEDWASAAETTKGFSGADLSNVATAAAFRPIRELHSATFWCFTTDCKIMPCSSSTLGAMQYTLDKLPANRVIARPVQLEDLMEAVRSTSRTVPTSLIQQYEEFQQF